MLGNDDWFFDCKETKFCYVLQACLCRAAVWLREQLVSVDRNIGPARQPLGTCSQAVSSNYLTRRTIFTSLPPQCPNIRVSRANSTWQVSASLPRQFCVPGHVTDDMVTRMAVTCTGRRPPVWLWGGDTRTRLYITPHLCFRRNQVGRLTFHTTRF